MWEWEKGIRSYLHPVIFAGLYKVLALFHLDKPCFMVRIVYPGCLPNVSNNGREAASKTRLNQAKMLISGSPISKSSKVSAYGKRKITTRKNASDMIKLSRIVVAKIRHAPFATYQRHNYDHLRSSSLSFT
ncbi:uncharacterized protein LOC107015918 [Solanum pennellii]|uniref:Uncharacterized protein LOC107015918 n=1 Tax=Solanum pennellii TaxID=28526 RepID=A0ABM1V539_SOLPN|nr:uncharacterized protein LOC107015918 [Solanum pennellii]